MLDTLCSGWITTGPKTKEFEQRFAEYVGARHAIAVNSCTAAMHLALEAIGLQEDDEVIPPPTPLLLQPKSCATLMQNQRLLIFARLYRETPPPDLVILGGVTMAVFSEAIESIQHQDTSLVASRKIRVLLVITGLATGGATNVVLDIASHFNNHPDFDVQLLTGPIPAGKNDVTYLAYERDITTRVIPSLINHINPIVNVKAVADIRRIIVQGNYDIVHTHSSVAGVVGRTAAFVARVPITVHHVHGWGLQEGMSTGMRMLYLGLERLCAKFTDRIIVVSRPDIQKGQAHRIGREDKFALIYNGIALEKFRQPVDDQQMRSELGLDPDCKLVGMIGRLDEQKNPLDFIRAAAIVTKSYSKVQFLIVGGGSLHPECEQLINELNLKEKLFLLGYRNDVARILSILTLTAMSSLWEGLPIAFLESMSAGKPIVANDVDGASDVVIDGETGFLVPPHQPSQMAERILYLLNNEKLCNEMGHVAQQRSRYFSTQRMVRQIESLYKELYSAAQQRTKAGLTVPISELAHYEPAQRNQGQS